MLSTSWGSGRPSGPAAPGSTSWGTGRPGRLAAVGMLSLAVLGALAAAPTRATAHPAPPAVRVESTGAVDSGRGWSAQAATGAGAFGAGGRGETVAVLDSGISEVPALAGRVVQGVDLTGEGFADGYGHGTFVAGLIAGNGLDARGRQTGIVGVAPQATVLSVKVVDDRGRSDERTLAAGLVWVLQNHLRYGIDVVNISLGVGAADPDPATEPVDALVEAVWHAGMVVVVSAGNDGNATPVRSAPADDPTVLTVGAVYADGDGDAADDQLAPFTDWGSTRRGVTKPEISAPGVHLQSTLPSTTVLARQQTVTGLPAGYGQLSGTSMSAAVVSGLAADTLAVDPWLRPAQLKSLAVQGAEGPARSLSLAAAAHADPNRLQDPPPSPSLARLGAALSSAAGRTPNTRWTGGSGDAGPTVVWSTAVWSTAVWSTVVWSSSVSSSSVWSTVVWSSALPSGS